MSRPAPVKRPRRQRGSISADHILTGAFEIADEVSVDNLSMPLLAKHLGVGVTSIYWYFRRKDELLDAMTTRVIGEVGFDAPPIDSTNWRTSLEYQARTVRAVFRDHPILCDLLLIRNTYTGLAGRVAMRTIEQAVQALVQAGMTTADAFDIYTTLATYTRGSVILQRIQEKSGYANPSGADPRGRRVGIADDATYEYVLNSILDRAATLIA